MVLRICFVALMLFSAACSRVGDPSSTTSTQAGGEVGSLHSAIASVSSPSAGAQRARALTLPVAQGFAAAPDRGDLVAYPTRPVVREDGAYTWHRAEISEAHALAAIGSGRLRIRTPAGALLDFAYERHVEHPSGDWTWIGRLQHGAASEEALLTFGARAAFGSIAQPGQEPLRLTIRDGVSWLVETDRQVLGRIVNAATRPRKQDFLLPPDLPARAGQGSQSLVASAPMASSVPDPFAATAPNSGTVVDAVLGYTDGFAASLGGPSAAVTRLNNLVETVNQAYVNSQVNARIRLVHALQVSYPDATKNETALEELTGYKSGTGFVTPSAAFGALRAARDQYGADLVSLVRKFNDPENEGCGVAWLLGGGRTTIDGSDAPFAYSVVSDGTDLGADGKTYFCREETLAHEFGHNMGSQHDMDNAKDDNGALRYGAYSYSFGYSTAVDAGNFITIMAYAVKDRTPRQTAYRVFSNPRTTYCGGLACGIEDQADNARSLSQTIPLIAGFRATVVPDIPPPTQPLKARSDIDADGRSDLLLENGGQALTAYWIMNGAVPVRYSPAFAQPAGYARAATGDFNGDSRLDIVWARSSNRQLLLWQGDGTGFTQLAIRDYSAGWAVTGAGDVDGDGRSDLLLANASQGLFAYWIMNGAVPLRYSSAFTQPAGYAQVASGDYNGDGRLDLVWARSSDRQLLLWQGDGTGFTQVSIRDYSAGWAVTGAGDIDGDGRSDLMLANASQGLFAYWIMNGAVPLRYSSAFTQPAEYAQGASGDYNGDGRLDLVWARSSDRTLLLWQGDGNGFTQVAIRDYSAGWAVVDDGSANGPKVRAPSDIDADGRSDLLLENGGQALTAYWIMNGAVPVRYSPAFAQPAGYSRVTTGDFNGDSRLDIVWARSSDRQLLLWQGDGTGFTQLSIRDYSAGWAVTGAGDIDGDGRSDLLLANAGQGLFAYWIMNGAVPVRYSSAFTQPAGYAQVATGDFNGDGRLDVVWARSSDRQLLLWQGDGTVFTQLSIRDYSAGWAVTGAGDIDGDGRSDLLLANASQGLFAYWVMNGAVPVRYSSAFSDPVGYVRVATGDYNGDAKLDLVWARSSDRNVLMWQGDGTGFTAIGVGTHSVGWSITPP